jgi:PTS system nitrogen regulatory IIA component
MDLKIKDIALLLNVNEKVIQKWIKEKKIPFYNINHQYRFNKAEITEWILIHKVEFSASLIKLGLADRYSLIPMLEKGGIIIDIPGSTSKDVLKNAAKNILNTGDLTTDDILTALLNREDLMTTAIGKGIALPHPHSPIVTNPDNASISICYLREPVDFGALDGLPVHTLIILLTASPKMHLEVLSKISYLCRDEKFRELLNDRKDKETVLSFVKIKELEWLEVETNKK